MRDASLDLARGNIANAVGSYGANGRMMGSALKSQAVENLIYDWNREDEPARSALSLAHRRRAVRMLHKLATANLAARGLADGSPALKTEHRCRPFAAAEPLRCQEKQGRGGA